MQEALQHQQQQQQQQQEQQDPPLPQAESDLSDPVPAVSLTAASIGKSKPTGADAATAAPSVFGKLMSAAKGKLKAADSNMQKLSTLEELETLARR